MKTHCPDCGEKYSEPQPDENICGSCAFKLALSTISNDPVLKQKLHIIKREE